MFWAPAKGYQLKNKIPTREIKLALRWYRPQKYLVTGGFDLVINIYKNLKFTDFGKLKNIIDLVSLRRLHFEMITDILIKKTEINRRL